MIELINLSLQLLRLNLLKSISVILSSASNHSCHKTHLSSCSIILQLMKPLTDWILVAEKYPQWLVFLTLNLSYLATLAHVVWCSRPSTAWISTYILYLLLAYLCLTCVDGLTSGFSFASVSLISPQFHSSCLCPHPTLTRFK